MAGKLFDRLEQEAFRGGIQARTKESMKWFRTRVSQIKRVNSKEIQAEARQKWLEQLIVQANIELGN